MTSPESGLALLPFEEASDQVVDFLAQTVPMAFWSVTRVVDGRQVYLSVRDDAYGKVAGDSVAWSESMCQHMVAGTAPAIAPDAMAVPEYAGTTAARTLTIGSYVGAPIRAADGTLFGTICGIDPGRRPDELLARAPGLRLLADLLSRVLEAASLQAQAERRTRHVQEAQASLARSEAMYRLLVGATRDAISRHDASGALAFVSPAAQALFGWSPETVLGRNWAELVHPDDLPGIRDQLAAGDGGESTFRVLHGDEHWVWVEATWTVVRDDDGQVLDVLVCSRDITARRARDAASQRESLERLSAGLAHGINTPMQYVGDNARFLAEAFEDLMGLVEVYRETLEDPATGGSPDLLPAMRAAEQDVEIGFLQTEVPSAVAQTLAGIDRVAAVVRAMRVFSHPGHGQHVPTDLNEALSAAVTVTQHQVAQVADVELELGELPPVWCDVAELNQAFVALVVNAADAVEETGRRGVVRVRTVRDGADVVVSVSDDGVGIPEEVRSRVFDPFFTTKAVGRGTGQGLPLARTVVQDGHGGTLSFRTEPGVGTTMTVRLPIAGVRSAGPRALAGAGG
ncbi:ATP-binding protein [Modestobacter sp. VKM Ac-2986]|uniref:ATP-binding protein n=1 Tax=Modestobacter sp. VKM Ac-2986 TaxID=3004140 RepID=UPI0022AB3027|nr:ATP-binding protein [Modestobacter sp. VKM Ac-2986]MCZ2827550.1 ATP-binding protein [Modestobacter sp. VKM Ac-2986]